ncbi:MAG TPA: SDR family NAD(P)-dependent oxidoreductase [Aliidongia sp.]|uniref:SDR family NAD(P)-dependent oxidoreductase n=1 Tax=Aliidongia sp. TaxID=1914230 RepID=UPI002DDD23C4|nr:SDR family NAD(P)-dependent oxidoreductase [Aliidongia sp.]HEV2678420.1 SDR family NAD(P)-dependent oxidoreductase [Aliidongia sp.]
MTSKAAFQNIVITGASSGIGAALAKFYARPGVTLGLTGRDPVRLGVVAAEVEAAGGTVVQGLLDLRDRSALTGFLTGFDARHPVDLLIANAGVLDGRHADGVVEDAEIARRVIEINLLGAVDTLHALLPAMRARRRGHIVLVSSLAALSPLPDAPAYSASKAGLLSYGRALRGAVAGEKIRVSVVCPGYVTSAMTETHIGNHPHKIGADEAARLIGAGIARNKPVIGFPTQLYLLSLISPFFPEFVVRLATKDIRFHVAPRD